MDYFIDKVTGKPFYYVEIIESERGWGSKIDETKEFGTKEQALEFITTYNSVNNLPEPPDWYMYARLKTNLNF